MAHSRIFIYANEQERSELFESSRLSLELDEENYRHLVKALRIRSGERFEIVLRDSWECFSLRFLEAPKGGRCIIVDDAQHILSEESPLKIELIFGVSKLDKNERIIRQATEMGVSVLSPTIFERTSVRFDDAKKVNKDQRFATIARQAAMQAHRSLIPECKAIESLSKRLETLEADLIYALWEEESGKTLFERAQTDIKKLISDQGANSDASNEELRIVLLVGPEGGISAQEIEALTKLGAQVASLGKNILRVDTANIVAVAQIHDAFQGVSSC